MDCHVAGNLSHARLRDPTISSTRQLMLGPTPDQRKNIRKVVDCQDLIAVIAEECDGLIFSFAEYVLKAAESLEAIDGWR